MTKISKKTAYPIKNPVVGDFFVGTDSENNNKTVSFGFEYAANLINRINGSLIINYMFKTDVNIPLAVLTEGHFLSQDNNTDINTVTKLYVNKTNFQEDDLSDLFLFIKENTGDYYFKLQNSENLINAVYFNINSIVAYSEYFEFNIAIDKTNPSLTTLVDSNIYFFTFEIKSNITKTSDLENDGADGIHPFITAEDLPEPIDVSGKEDKSEKGQANGYAPLNGFTKIASVYLDIVNDLVTGGATSILSAEQGKQLQLQVDAINSILFSDNVNLDTVQEIVDAIESLQGYLDTILVNDLTTGGTTKALTAEMGKTLKGLIDALTTVVSDLQTDVTAIDNRVTVLENYNPPPQTGWTGLPVAVWSGVGLIYDYVFPKYYLEGVEYPAISGSITLTAADPTNPRFTSIIADASGVNEVLGVAQENPPTPSLDPNTQLFVINVLINAGETTPANTSQSLIYDEGTEWTGYSSHANITLNNTVGALNGTNCINVASSVNDTYFEFEAPEPQSIVEADGFKFWIKLTASIFTNRGFKVAFYNGTTKVSNEVSFKRPNGLGGTTTGLYGISYLNTTDYQLIVIPFQDLDFQGSTYTKIRFTFISSISAKFDYLALMTSGGGFGTSPDKKGIKTIITQNGIKTVDTAEASIVLNGTDGISTYVNENGEVEVSGINLSNRIGNLENFGKSQYESYWVGFSLSGVITDLDLSVYVSTSLDFTDAISELNSVIYNSAPTQPYSGQEFFIKNSQSTSFVIKHENGNIATEQRYIFSLPNETDLELLPKHIAHFKLKYLGGSRGMLELVGTILDESKLMHLDGDEEVDGNKTFLQPVSGEAATNPEHLVTKAQLDLKLDASVYNDRFKGVYTSLTALETAHPTANAGDRAQVNEVGAAQVVTYVWDAEDEVWVLGGGSGSGATNTDELPEGSTNFYFTNARAIAAVDISGKEDTSNKTGTVIGNEASTSLYLHIAGMVAYFQQKLTDSIFGSFINSLTAKTTPVDADSISIVDTEDSNKQKKLSLTNFKAFLKSYFDGFYLVPQITITTTTSITTDTTASGLSQKGRNTIINNGVNAINLTINGGTGFCASYVKHGTGTITFVQGSGRTLVQVDGTAILNGAVGSTATITSMGTTDYLRISNA